MLTAHVTSGYQKLDGILHIDKGMWPNLSQNYIHLKEQIIIERQNKDEFGQTKSSSI